MAPGVGQVEAELTDVPLERNLHRVVVRVCAIQNLRDVAVAQVWAVWVGAGRSDAAGYVELNPCLSCRGNAVHRAAAAVSRRHRLSRRIRILRLGDRVKLVEVSLLSKMRSLAADVGDAQHHVLSQLPLYAEAPLLNIRPHHRRVWD